jgi:hypothetical protein
VATNRLKAILRVRELAVEQARKELAACSRAELHIQQLVEEISAAIKAERHAAPLEAFHLIEGLSSWFRCAQRAKEEHRSRQQSAYAATARARTYLTTCQEAKEIAGKLATDRRLKERGAADRNDQLREDGVAWLARLNLED